MNDYITKLTSYAKVAFLVKILSNWFNEGIVYAVFMVITEIPVHNTTNPVIVLKKIDISTKPMNISFLVEIELTAKGFLNVLDKLCNKGDIRRQLENISSLW